MRPRVCVLLNMIVVSLSSLSLSATELVKLSTRDGVSQSFLYSRAERAHASVILFAGGHGNLKLQDDGTIGWGTNNFLLRSREYFINAGCNVAVFDAPSDHQGRDGMLGGFRNSEEHAVDIAATVKYLRAQSNVPVWVVGTSRGTESVANVAVRSPLVADGVVLTSSMSVKNDKGFALPELELNKVTVPVLLTVHEDDACWVTPPEGSEAVKAALVNAKRLELKRYHGGLPARTDACKALSAHGFYGIEEEVVRDIVSFIRQRD